MRITLIHPPVVRPCEPPAGLAAIAGAFKHADLPVTLIDANYEALMSLASGFTSPMDTWTRRAHRHLERNVELLKSKAGYTDRHDRYARSIADINRILDKAAPAGITPSLADYKDKALSPVKSADLIRVAENPRTNAFYPYFISGFLEDLERQAPDLVGFSLNYLSQALCSFAMIGVIKQHASQIRIVLGGSLITSWMRRAGWINPFSGLVDDLIDGPGEAYLLGLAGEESSEAAGIPDYQAFEHVPYLSPGRILPYSTSRGCYWNRCSFCPERAEGTPFSARIPMQTAQLMREMAERERPVLIHLLDNALSPAMLSALAKHPPGVPWYGFARIGPQLGDPDFCRALKESGCVMLQLGLESGDQSVLDALEKGIDLEDSRRALMNLKQAGIATYAYLLFGTPAETCTSALETMAFVLKHAGELTFLNLSIFNLPVGSPEGDSLETYDFYAGDLSLYKGFIHPGGWNRDRVRQFLDKEFKRQPQIAAIIRRDPPVFTSNHAPFFVMNSIPHSSGTFVGDSEY